MKKIFLILVAVICMSHTGCEDRIDESMEKMVDLKDQVTLRIHDLEGDQECGLYVIDKNNIIVKSNIRVVGGKITEEIYNQEGYVYFLYSPFVADPVGLTKEGEMMGKNDVVIFFRPLAEIIAMSNISAGDLRVARGLRACKERGIVMDFYMVPWEDDLSWWKYSE